VQTIPLCPACAGPARRDHRRAGDNINAETTERSGGRCPEQRSYPGRSTGNFFLSIAGLADAADLVIDATLKHALSEFDETKRNQELREAAHIAFTDGGIIPLYWQTVRWAARKSVRYEPRRDEERVARGARPGTD
jgi:hypothetical protein